MRKFILAVFVSLILVPSVATFAVASTRGDPKGKPGSEGPKSEGHDTITPDPADKTTHPADPNAHDLLIPIGN